MDYGNAKSIYAYLRLQNNTNITDSNIGYAYLILSEVNDFEEIRDWAAFHQI